MLTLSVAIKENRIAAFIREQAELGIGPISSARFGQYAEAVVKAPRLPDQTSGSRVRDSSSEKKTR